MSCPTCQDWRDEGLCPQCVRDGWEEYSCGCLDRIDEWGRLAESIKCRDCEMAAQERFDRSA